MDNQTNTDKYYRVVRYHADFGIGTVQDILGSHLTMEEAEKIVKENPKIVSDEDVFIEEETPVYEEPKSIF
jgi:hypothetical protein